MSPRRVVMVMMCSLAGLAGSILAVFSAEIRGLHSRMRRRPSQSIGERPHVLRKAVSGEDQVQGPGSGPRRLCADTNLGRVLMKTRPIGRRWGNVCLALRSGGKPDILEPPFGARKETFPPPSPHRKMRYLCRRAVLWHRAKGPLFSRYTGGTRRNQEGVT